MNSFRFPVHDKAGYAVINNFRYRTRPERDNRRAARHRFDHDQTERFGPVDRKQQSRSIRQKLLLGSIIYFTSQPNLVAIDFRFKPFLEVTPLTTRYFRRDAKRHSCGTRNANGDFRPLFGGESAEKGKIRSRLQVGADHTAGARRVEWAKPGSLDQDATCD